MNIHLVTHKKFEKQGRVTKFSIINNTNIKLLKFSLTKKCIKKFLLDFKKNIRKNIL